MVRLALLALVLVACGGNKIAPAVVDDFALPILSACRAVDECASGCTESACVAACENGVDSASVQAYEALIACVIASCTGATDAGAPDAGSEACASMSDTSTPCTKCITAAEQSACTTEYATCTTAD